MAKEKGQFKTLINAVTIAVGIICLVLGIVLPIVLNIFWVSIPTIAIGTLLCMIGFVNREGSFLTQIFNKNKVNNAKTIYRTPEQEKELIDKINSTSGGENYRALVEYYSNGSESLTELFMTSFGFSKENREFFKSHNHEIIMSILILVFSIICFTLPIIGFIVSTITGNKIIHYYCMGVGLGAFALFFFSALFINKLKGYRGVLFSNINLEKLNDYQLEELKKRFYIHLGNAKRSLVYSQSRVSFQFGSRNVNHSTTRILNTTYKIWVSPLSFEDTNNLFFANNKTDIILYGKLPHRMGETVCYLQEKKHPKRFFLIDEGHSSQLNALDDSNE